MMNIEIVLYDNENYTDYSLESELKVELKKFDRNILSFNSKRERQRIVIRKQNMIVVNIEIDGENIEDPDEFNNTVSIAIIEATNKLSLVLNSVYWSYQNYCVYICTKTLIRGVR